MKKLEFLLVLVFLILGCSKSEPSFYKNLYTNEIYTTLEFEKFIGNVYATVSDSIIKNQGLTNPNEIKETLDSLSKEIRISINFKKDIISGDSIIRPFDYNLRIGNKYLIRSDKFEKIGFRVIEKKHKTLQGEEIIIGGKQDKPTLINLWFIGCRGCVEEMPALNYLKSKYADKVNFVAVTFDKHQDVIKFLDKKEFNFTHLANKEEFIEEIATKPYPENIFVDKNGTIRYIESGLGGGDNLDFATAHFEKILKELINE
jgi:thiol-disulfide isomerase/thioredoxin